MDDKKDAILNCSVMMSEEHSLREVIVSYMYTVQPMTIIVSAILVAAAVINHMLDSQPNDTSFTYRILLMVNFLLVVFLILERVVRVVAIGYL